MEAIVREIKLGEICKYLSYEDITRYCQVSKEFNLINKSISIWEYLLNRDFNVISTEENIREVYLLNKRAIDHFSKFYPIITHRALQILVKLIHIWYELDEAIKEHREEYESDDYSSILSLDELNVIRLTRHGFERIILENLIGTMSDIKLIYPNFDNMVKQLKQDNYEEFKILTSNPTIIFVNKKPILINYDYELAIEFTYNVHLKSYSQQVLQMEINLLNLIDES